MRLSPQKKNGTSTNMLHNSVTLLQILLLTLDVQTACPDCALLKLDSQMMSDYKVGCDHVHQTQVIPQQLERQCQNM